MTEVFGVTTSGRSSSITEPAGNVLLIIVHDVNEGPDHNDIDDKAGLVLW